MRVHVERRKEQSTRAAGRLGASNRLTARCVRPHRSSTAKQQTQGILICTPQYTSRSIERVPKQKSASVVAAAASPLSSVRHHRCLQVFAFANVWFSFARSNRTMSYLQPLLYILWYLQNRIAHGARVTSSSLRLGSVLRPSPVQIIAELLLAWRGGPYPRVPACCESSGHQRGYLYSGDASGYRYVLIQVTSVIACWLSSWEDGSQTARPPSCFAFRRLVIWMPIPSVA